MGDFGGWSSSLRKLGGQLVEIMRHATQGDFTEDDTDIASTVRRVTNEDAWGASPTEMHILVDRMAAGPDAREEAMAALRLRLDTDQSGGRVGWRAIYKALVLYEYILLHGPESHVMALTQASSQERISDHGMMIDIAASYKSIDARGVDNGEAVRLRAAAISKMIAGNDDASALVTRLRIEAAETRSTMLRRKREAALANTLAQDKSSLKILSEVSIADDISESRKNCAAPVSDSLIDFDNTPVENFDLHDEALADNFDKQSENCLAADAESLPKSSVRSDDNSLAGYLSRHSNLVDF